MRWQGPQAQLPRAVTRQHDAARRDAPVRTGDGGHHHPNRLDAGPHRLWRPPPRSTLQAARSRTCRPPLGPDRVYRPACRRSASPPPGCGAGRNRLPPVRRRLGEGLNLRATFCSWPMPRRSPMMPRRSSLPPPRRGHSKLYGAEDFFSATSISATEAPAAEWLRWASCALRRPHPLVELMAIGDAARRLQADRGTPHPSSLNWQINFQTAEPRTAINGGSAPPIPRTMAVTQRMAIWNAAGEPSPRRCESPAETFCDSFPNA